MTSRFDRIVNDIKGMKLDLRMNDLTEMLEVKYKDAEWQDLEDTIEAIILMDMEELGYGVRGKKKPAITSVQRAWVKLADKQRYHPIKRYFDSLPGYEPKNPAGSVSPQPYMVHTLASYFGNPDGMFGVWLFKWLTGCIAKLYEQERNPMLVLVSEQEKGKSFFAQWLCSMGKEYFLEGPINPESKDARLRLTDRFIHEVGELGATTRRADSESLKEFITKKFNTDRYPYGKRPMTKPCVCNFIGSVNHDGAGFLNDPTGSTRFLACEIEKINWSYTDIDPDILWSEALWFYRNSEKCWQLNSQEKEDRNRINSQFEMVEPLADYVDQFLEITGSRDDFMTTVEIMDYLGKYYRFTNEKVFSRDLARVLHKQGLKPEREPYRKGQPHRRGYYGLKRRGTVSLDE